MQSYEIYFLRCLFLLLKMCVLRWWWSESLAQQKNMRGRDSTKGVFSPQTFAAKDANVCGKRGNALPLSA